jgi:hypothetical protein
MEFRKMTSILPKSAKQDLRTLHDAGCDRLTPKNLAKKAASLVINGYKPSVAEVARALQISEAAVMREITKSKPANSAGAVPAIDGVWDTMSETERVGFFRRRQSSVLETLDRATTA